MHLEAQFFILWWVKCKRNKLLLTSKKKKRNKLVMGSVHVEISPKKRYIHPFSAVVALYFAQKHIIN